MDVTKRNPPLSHDKKHMETISRMSSWLGRAVLLVATIIFTLISIRFFSDPVGAAASAHIITGTPTAVTMIRVGFGGFPLAIAIINVVCLVSAKRLLTGLYFLTIMIGVITFVRIWGAVADGATPETLKVLRPEIVLLALSMLSIALEYRTRRWLHSQPGQFPRAHGEPARAHGEPASRG
jgi:hypothetical protein